MEPAHSIIKALGGPEAVARELKVHRTRVYSWMRSQSNGGTGGAIPQRHFQKILGIAGERGLPITAIDLITPSETEAA